MEVTTVSPSPASPTEGDDLCETDGTSVATHSVTLLIGLCGLAGNGAVISLLRLKIRNAGIFGLAVFDLLFLLLTVPSALLFLVEDMSCSPILPLPYLSFLFLMSAFSYCCGVLWLIANSPLLYMHKLRKLCCCWELPEHLRRVVDSVQYWAIFVLPAGIVFVTLLCPSHQLERCRVPLISMYTIILLLVVAPVLISCALDFINAKQGSQQQQPKRRDIVIFLIALFFLFLSIWNFLQQLGYIPVPSEIFFLLTCIHSSIKPFFYFLVGQCWRPCSMGSLRLSLQRVFEEPRENTACRNDPAMDTGV